MIEYNNGDMIITGDDALAFAQNAVHPNRDTIARRNAFFAMLDADQSMRFSGTDMTIDVSDLNLGKQNDTELDSMSPCRFETGGQYAFAQLHKYVCRKIKTTEGYCVFENCDKGKSEKRELRYGSKTNFNMMDKSPEAA